MSQNQFIPPNSADLEAAILGAALQEAPALRTVLGILTTEDAFYVTKHRLVYRAMQELFQAGEDVDILTVTQRLQAKSQLEGIGGPATVAKLTYRINGAAHLESHCRIVQQQYARRVIIKAGIEMQKHGYDQGRDPLDLLAGAQNQINLLHQSFESRSAQSVAGIVPSVFDYMRQKVQLVGSSLTGVPTGLTDLNDAGGGWQNGDLVIIAARPAMGKTAVMLNAGRAAALQAGVPTAIFSLEMPAHQLVQRLIASEVEGYSNSAIRQVSMPGGVDEVNHVAQRAGRLFQAHNFFIDDSSDLSIGQLRAKASRLKAEHNIGLIMVDYIQLMDGKQGGGREQEVGSISRGLKKMAKELNVPVIALAQLSRQVEQRGGEKRPQMSDLRESGSLEQDADMIIFLWRGEYYNIDQYADGSTTENTLLLDIAKHRNGDVGPIIANCSMKRGLVWDRSKPVAPAGQPHRHKAPLPGSTDFVAPTDEVYEG